MNKKYANKWVKNLLSGKFSQTDGALIKFVKDENDDDTAEVEGHCCLGVLAEINGFEREELVGSELLCSSEMQRKCNIKTENGAILDESGEVVSKAIKFKVKNKTTGKMETREFDDLAEANDKGIGFKKIARWIEKNYKSL